MQRTKANHNSKTFQKCLKYVVVNISFAKNESKSQLLLTGNLKMYGCCKYQFCGSTQANHPDFSIGIVNISFAAALKQIIPIFPSGL
ncbi:MAG: hypothetical protein IE931_06820 [Sphingobacteriales bacterium]|nr:hypothetical protein [Sphingobacteriales bacterium]